MRDSTRFIPLAAIAQPHGVHGRVKLKLFSESLDSFERYIPHMRLEDGTPISLKITSEAGGAPVAEIAAIKNREEAQLWRGKLLGVPRSIMQETADNEYYIEDLIGLSLITTTGEPFGTIRAVENYGAGDILVIDCVNGSEALLPLTDEIFPQIDIDAGTATICPPEMLIASENEPNG